MILTIAVYVILGGPEGCTGGESTRQATPEQKRIFGFLVELIEDFGIQHATTAA